MRYTPEEMNYLQGEEYSNGLICSFKKDANDKKYVDRSSYLETLVRGKRVLHIGCVDHNVETIEHKIRRGKWLHKRLHDAASHCVGIDINPEGIEHIRQRLGYKDCYTADITQTLPTALSDTTWDYVLLPEVLEHIDNPVSFLSLLKEQLSPYAKHLVITVPNAFHKANYAFAQKGLEAINTDHRYWFTPYTLGKVVTQAGLQADHFILCNHGRIKRRSLLKNLWLKHHPLMRSDIVMHAELG